MQFKTMRYYYTINRTTQIQSKNRWDVEQLAPSVFADGHVEWFKDFEKLSDITAKPNHTSTLWQKDLLLGIYLREMGPYSDQNPVPRMRIAFSFSTAKICK